jgi:hypothetical protein
MPSTECRFTLALMEQSDFFVLLAIVLTLVATGFAAWRARLVDGARRLISGAVVTVLGLVLLIAFYRWGFEQDTCSSRGDLVCLTNKNQGVLTLLAVLIAAVAVWVEVLSRRSELMAVERERSRHANQAVADAIEECHHNLLHVALCYTDGVMDTIPWGMSIDDICALGDREYRHIVDEDVLRHIDRIRRTYESTQELRMHFLNARSDEEQEEARKLILAEPYPFQGFVVHHMGFLRDAWEAYKDVPGCRERLEQPGLQDLPRIVAAGLRSDLYGYFRTSDEDAQAEAPTIRTEEATIMCWFDDSPIGVRTFALGPRFEDASLSHSHS